MQQKQNGANGRCLGEKISGLGAKQSLNAAAKAYAASSKSLASSRLQKDYYD